MEAEATAAANASLLRNRRLSGGPASASAVAGAAGVAAKRRDSTSMQLTAEAQIVNLERKVDVLMDMLKEMKEQQQFA
jgi:hypothetical protein